METRPRKQGPAAEAAAAAFLSAFFLGAVAYAQGPTVPDLVAVERGVQAAKAARAESLRALAADEDRLRTALSLAVSRRQEAETRTKALGRTLQELQSARSAAESRTTAVLGLRARLEAALLRAAAAIRERRPPGETDLSGGAAVRETGAPLARRLSALFHLLDRSRPEEARVAVLRHVGGGVAGRILRIGAVVSYFVPDDAGFPPLFYPSGRPLPPEFVGTVRRAADIADKKADAAVLRLPTEPRS